MDQQDLKELKGYREYKATLDPQGLKDFRELQGLLECKVTSDPWDHKEFREVQDPLERREYKAMLDP